MYETKVAFNKDDIRLSMPLMKVDTERRTVHGFATLDNLDRQDDIVTKSASVAAFSKFRGNIREQHDPHKAVGRVVNFNTNTYFDADTKKVYDGVFVSAYISKGAEDTWQKVLDGTLSGFSIGGAIKRIEHAYDEDLDRPVRIIKEYELTELSLVDSPANQLANVISIEKSDSGEMTVLTPLVKSGLENIFWCEKDKTITLKSEENQACPICDLSMTNIGFVEDTDTAEEKGSVVKTFLEQFKKSTMVNTVEPIVKEASNMADEATTEEAVTEEVEKSDEVVEETAPAEQAEVENTEKADVEEVVKTEEVPEAEAVVKDAAGKIDELSSTLTSSLSTLVDAVKALNTKIDEVNKSIIGVQNDVADVKSSANDLGKRVDAVEDTTAFRKSGDLGEVVQEQRVQKSESVWGGAFLTTADL